jgi:hypothetical protein
MIQRGLTVLECIMSSTPFSPPSESVTDSDEFFETIFSEIRRTGVDISLIDPEILDKIDRSFLRILKPHLDFIGSNHPEWTEAFNLYITDVTDVIVAYHCSNNDSASKTAVLKSVKNKIAFFSKYNGRPQQRPFPLMTQNVILALNEWCISQEAGIIEVSIT